ncbi:MAG: hypothetical protein R3320_10700, partial [Nitriliruptorales bacterium]|nr:hypothetical protein [Nitriliruptorales bacterium]
MTTGALATRFGRSSHLVELIAELERAAQRLREHASDLTDEHREALQADAAVASMQLDGSSIISPPADAEGLAGRSSELATGAAPRRRQGTWLDAMATQLEEASDEVIVAREYLGVRAAIRSDDLSDVLLTAPIETCRELHRRLTAGLLEAQHAGQPRVTSQAVHDASVGRIIYFPSEPAQIPAHL